MNTTSQTGRFPARSPDGRHASSDLQNTVVVPRDAAGGGHRAGVRGYLGDQMDLLTVGRWVDVGRDGGMGWNQRLGDVEPATSRVRFHGLYEECAAVVDCERSRGDPASGKLAVEGRAQIDDLIVDPHHGMLKVPHRG